MDENKNGTNPVSATESKNGANTTPGTKPRRRRPNNKNRNQAAQPDSSTATAAAPAANGNRGGQAPAPPAANGNRGGNRGKQNKNGDSPRTEALSTAAGGEAKKTNSRRSRKKQPNAERKSPVRIASLGGLSEIGKNMTVIECEDDMFIVDCGLAFPDDEMFGVDIVIPDFTYVERNKEKFRGIVVTHGHEDHIGSLSYLLKLVNLPVYGTRITLGLIAGKLKEHGLAGKVKLIEMSPGETAKLGCVDVEFINVNHSIPGACALALHTPAGCIVMTGDFKVDYTPISGEIIDLARFGELGRAGVLALLSDSTNAERVGTVKSERVVGAAFDNLFKRAKDKRIIIATFSSNVYRIQQVVDACVMFDRKLAVSGRSMLNVLGIATELGYLNIPEGLVIEVDMITKHRDCDVVILTTGSQGEPMSALTRMAMGEHRKVQVTSNDFIIFSASPIPGNEKTVSRVVDELMKLGADVIYERMYDVHVSGHANQDELKLMIALTKPKFFIPVHGEYHHLKKHAEIAISMGIPEENVFISEIGRVLETDGVDMKFNGVVPAGSVMVDGIGVGDVGSIVLRDRKHLGQDGLIIVVVAIDGKTGAVVTGPDIVSRGFVYVRESEEMIAEARRVCKQAIAQFEKPGGREWGNIKSAIRDQLGGFLYNKTKRTPMILPVIQEV